MFVPVAEMIFERHSRSLTLNTFTHRKAVGLCSNRKTNTDIYLHKNKTLKSKTFHNNYDSDRQAYYYSCAVFKLHADGNDVDHSHLPATAPTKVIIKQVLVVLLRRSKVRVWQIHESTDGQLNLSQHLEALTAAVNKPTTLQYWCVFCWILCVSRSIGYKTKWIGLSLSIVFYIQ